MVLPLDSLPSSATLSPFVRETERPVLPEPALQVTASSDNQGSGSATSGHPPPQQGDALDEINGSLQAWATGMRFEMDPDAQRLVVSIIDSKTGETLRTVPSDAVIRIAKMIVQLQGQNVDTKA